MQMDEGLDTGPVLARRALPIGPSETAAELAERLSQLGAQLLREELPRYLAGELVSAPQDAERMTLAPILQKTHGAIDWQRSAQQVHDLVRGMTPWPGAYTRLPSGATLKVYATQLVAPPNSSNGLPGTVLCADRAHGLVVGCGEGALALDAVQPEGKRRMTAAEFLAGRGLAAGEMLGAPARREEQR
jgi:methionyl-tRNA formyltransferase